MRAKNLNIFTLFLLLMVVNVILIGAAMIFYGEKYLFWQYPFSYAGTVKTVTGLSNIFSSYLYSTAMVLSGFVMLIAAYCFYARRVEQKNIFQVILCLLCAIGYIIAGLGPDDTQPAMHMLGSGLVVATLWIMATNNLFDIRKDLKTVQHLGLQAILQIPIFTYASAFFWDIQPLAAILQKFAVAGLGFILLYSVWYIENSKNNFIKDNATSSQNAR